MAINQEEESLPLVPSQTNDFKNTTPQKEKPKKLEEKPFEEFINDDLIPDLQSALNSKGVGSSSIVLKQDQRPVVGGDCWMIQGSLDNGRKFWITFDKANIKSSKNIALSESQSEPSLLESFLIDEKKITLKLITSRFIQRLNGQKWLGNN
ncbi:DUF2996 domain-containing protein [Prochlorococcus marinus]|uniref:DUF2996 domain-containing protein n=1 Tax=Prochlorococcus marinus TaxID=1219 RepID=UPI0022B53E10|nr:DUF2996 domain-containing protein [Prochlorococcus marinus]